MTAPARTLMRATALAVGTLTAMPASAQSLPGPDNRPAPGNETLAPVPRDSAFRPQANYQIECSGCHLDDGRGARANDVPRMQGFVGHFLEVEGGRDFLVRVPGVAQSSFTDAQLADVLNWILTGGIAGASTPADFTPYTADEVGRLRARPLMRIDAERDALLERMRALEIAITDGLAGRP